MSRCVVSGYPQETCGCGECSQRRGDFGSAPKYVRCDQEVSLTFESRDDLLEKLSLKVFGVTPAFVLDGEQMPKGKVPEPAEADAALHAGDAERLHAWWSSAIWQRDHLARENARLRSSLMEGVVKSGDGNEPLCQVQQHIREAADELCQALAERWFCAGDTEAQTARAVAAHKRLSDLLMEGGAA